MQDWLVTIPVWGDAYHALFERDVWPSIERALLRISGSVRFVFHTDDPNAIRKLIGKDAEAIFLWPSAGETWMSYSQAHREAAAYARKGEAIAFLNADILVSEECFAAAERRFAEGKRAIVMAATRTIGTVMMDAPSDARGLLEWSLFFAHNMSRECFYPQGETTVPCTIYYTDGENVILRGFFLHPFAVVKDGDLEFKGTVDQDALDSYPIEDIHVVTDPDECSLAEISLRLDRRLPHRPGGMTEDSIMAWAVGATSRHHRAFFTNRIVLRGSADTKCDAPADSIVNRFKDNETEIEVMRRWFAGAERHAEGYMGLAVQAWGAAMDYQYEMADRAGVPYSPRYLVDDWTSNIGHPAHIDLFVKAMKLGMVDTDYVVLADMDKVSTPTYLECWRPHIPMFPKTGYPVDWRLRREPTAVIKLEGKWKWFVDAQCEVERRWVEQGGKPLLHLPESEIEAGWQRIGLHPERDWFVTLHVRTGNDGQAGRDGNPEAYKLAIRDIIKAGGHVFWIPSGDRAHDIFLMSQCKFIIGNNAGPVLVSSTFGVPVIGANWWPVGIQFPYRDAIILPKLVRHHGKILSHEESMAEPFCHVQNPEVMKELGIELVPNNHVEIASAARSMMHRLGV